MATFTDINNKPIEVGSRAVYIGHDNEPERKPYVGRSVWVRDIQLDRDGARVRVDDGQEQDTDLNKSRSWRWTAWVRTSEIAVQPY